MVALKYAAILLNGIGNISTVDWNDSLVGAASFVVVVDTGVVVVLVVDTGVVVVLVVDTGVVVVSGATVVVKVDTFGIVSENGACVTGI